MEIAKKATRETTPPFFFPLLLSPAVSHPPHAKMKHTGEADALVPEFAARWHARREHLNKLYSTKYEKKENRKRMTYSSTSKKNHPNTYPRKIIQNGLENHRYLNNPTKRSPISMSRSRKTRITGNNFMKLVISI